MKKKLFCLIIGSLTIFASCTTRENKGKKPQKVLSFREQLAQISDSTRIAGITIKNLFKSQILAHTATGFDSAMIVEKVYHPHKALWDNCYGMIFGEKNAPKFNTEAGMIAWNKSLYPKHKDFFDKRVKDLIQVNLDSVLKASLTKFDRLVPYKVESTISILFTPLTGILFGGCANDQFCIELNHEAQEIGYTIKKGLPHELNHLAYEPLRENDPKKNTALRQTIDEGLACYFTWIFFNKEIPKYEAVENMTKQDWQWYVAHEKKIFTELKQYFDDESGDNPLLKKNKSQLLKNAPKSLNYWLGFRIIETYVKANGPESWRDLYKLNVQDVLTKSGYARYIEGLK
ncbi:MAG TPA: hypothetical protein DCS93_33655 [Microscillaceae bacterium]|nr:hypothetical protein [Microscillaceae bacterium]